MKSSRKLLSYILVLLSVVALSSCHSKKNVSASDYKPGKTTEPGFDYGSERGSEGWNYYSSRVIDEAKTWLGTPYKYGGSLKKKGTDCSGMTQQVYLTVTGIEIPRNSAQQSDYCKKVSNKKALPGDLVFFNTSGKGVSHVGIYLGNNCMIHASGSKGVMISSLTEKYWQNAYICCGRVPQMEILAQNYTPTLKKEIKKERNGKKDKEKTKDKKKNGKGKDKEPVNIPTPDVPITTDVMESDYAHNSSGPLPDDYAANHYASNWNETVENSTYATDYVAKARFKSKPTTPVIVPTTPAQPAVASTSNTKVESPSNATTSNATTNTTLASTTPSKAVTTNSTPTSTTTNTTLAPPTQHAEVFANYDQYGGTSISAQPSKSGNTKKDEAEKLYEEAVSSRLDNNVEISSATSTANVPSDTQKKKAISPAEAFAKLNGSNTTTNTTTNNVNPSVSTSKSQVVPVTPVQNVEEEEENPWMD